MRFLLDTHTFLWWTANDPQLSKAALAAIGDSANEVYLSAVSGWEIAIKARLGRLPLPEAPSVFVAGMVRRHNFKVLPINMRHAVHDYELPNHHPDPFDRLLVIQAKLEGLTLVTNDATISRYDVLTLW